MTLIFRLPGDLLLLWLLISQISCHSSLQKKRVEESQRLFVLDNPHLSSKKSTAIISRELIRVTGSCRGGGATICHVIV
jgi:hypothetical protein